MAIQGDVEDSTTSMDISGAIGHAVKSEQQINIRPGLHISSGRLADLDGLDEESAVRGESGAALSDEK